MSKHRKKSAEAAARLALANICRATIRVGDGEPRTGFVNVRTKKVLNFREWSAFHVMMTTLPHYWKAYSVVIADAWDGENWHLYDMTPKVGDRRERFLLSTITPYFDEAGQEVMDKQRRDMVLGHGTILFQNDKDMDDDLCMEIFDLVWDKGLTYAQIRRLR